MIEQRRTAIPGHGGGAAHHIVAGQRRHRNGDDLGEVEALPASARKSASMARKVASDQSIRSILLTASTTFLMPTRSQMAAWRRVWRFTPWRASTSRIATSACEAPVAMLRVYCSCPGASMMTKRRSGGLEIAPGDVDGDALLALGLKAVEQQAEIDLLAVEQRGSARRA